MDVKSVSAKQNLILLPLPAKLKEMSAEDATDAFIASEEHYVERALRVVSETFEKRLRVHLQIDKNVILQEIEIKGIFLNVTNIYDFNRVFMRI